MRCVVAYMVVSVMVTVMALNFDVARRSAAQ